MANHYTLLDMSAVSSYPADPQVDAAFDCAFTAVVTADADDVYLYVSFNGVDDHARLDRTTAATSVATWRKARRKVWLRCDLGSGSACTAQVRGEGL